jgi:hypothetical protein
VRAVFAERDKALMGAVAAHQEIVLWFEHDLYDQLQLLQVLAWLHTHPPLPERLSLLHPEGYLGAMPAEILLQVFPMRQTVHSSQLELAQRGWEAFTSDDPGEVLAIARLDEKQALPYLPGNFRRLLEEYPSTRNGLTRAQQEVLEAVARGARTREAVFAAVSEMEDPIFMGDWSVYRRLDELTPLAVNESCELTDLGRQLMAGEADWVEACGGIDVWLGGVHLTGTRPAWRWDAEGRTLRPGSSL